MPTTQQRNNAALALTVVVCLAILGSLMIFKMTGRKNHESLKKTVKGLANELASVKKKLNVTPTVTEEQVKSLLDASWFDTKLDQSLAAGYSIPHTSISGAPPLSGNTSSLTLLTGGMFMDGGDYPAPKFTSSSDEAVWGVSALGQPVFRGAASKTFVFLLTLTNINLKVTDDDGDLLSAQIATQGHHIGLIQGSNLAHVSSSVFSAYGYETRGTVSFVFTLDVDPTNVLEFLVDGFTTSFPNLTTALRQEAISTLAIIG